MARESREVARLGATPFQAAKLVFASVLFALEAFRRRPAERPINVRLAFRAHLLPCVLSHYSDIQVLHQVFIWRQYALPSDVPGPQVIFDAGSNAGFSALYFRIVHPGARIFAFEPDSVTFRKLVTNTRDHDGIIVRRVAFAGADGLRTFYRSSQSWTSSLLPRRSWVTSAEAAPEHQVAEKVEARTIASLMAEAGVDRVDPLKIDIEGAEWEILPQLAQLDTVDAVLGELHWDVETAPAIRELGR